MQYKYSILGGTFDKLHAGHKALISAACERSQIIHIGLTTEKFYQNKVLATLIDPYEVRLAEIAQFIKQKGWQDKTTIVELKDFYGEALIKKDIDALFVTEDTYKNALIMNKKREEKKFPPIDIIKVPLVYAEDSSPITSERIRKGEISREGEVYKNLFKANLILPKNLREELRNPIGKVVTKIIPEPIKSNEMLITVGDIVTLSFLDSQLVPSLSIIDFKTQRKNLDEEKMREKLNTNIKKERNDPGTVNKYIVERIQEKINQYKKTNVPQVITIDGEEDLLTLPAIMLAPLNTKILYGQIDQGAVVVQVTEEIKQYMKLLIKKFSVE